MNNFSEVLLAWYAENRRDLPWRETRDPYRIWISEIILQQTRVEQGRDYYLRFIGRFPDVKTLAAASEDEVMRYWQGLGYYSRARNLHEAARSMDGAFPETYDGVRALKGVGDYTAAAICSIAYDMPYAVVDGNVYRVLARYFGIDTPIDSSEGKKTFAVLAQEMLDRSRPALYNQAIMDYGALVCTPRSPECGACPLQETCMAFRKGLVNQLPVKRRKLQTMVRYLNYIYVHAGTYTYLHKRTADDIWKNLYEFPLIETDYDCPTEDFLVLPAFRRLFPDSDLIDVRVVCRNLKHILTHRVIYATFYELFLPSDSSLPEGYLKVAVDDLEHYAFSRLVQSFLEKYT